MRQAADTPEAPQGACRIVFRRSHNQKLLPAFEQYGQRVFSPEEQKVYDGLKQARADDQAMDVRGIDLSQAG